MKPTVLFLVGPPGAGKTTLARALLGGMTTSVPKPKWTVGDRVCAAGHYTGQTFDGADTVPYNGVRDALAYWEAHLAHLPLTILDGDRFSSKPTLAYFAERALVKVVHLNCSDEELARRRAARGSNQNVVWVKGRVTKARNFAMAFGEAERLMLDSTSPDLPRVVSSFAHDNGAGTP